MILLLKLKGQPLTISRWILAQQQNVRDYICFLPPANSHGAAPVWEVGTDRRGRRDCTTWQPWGPAV